MKINRCQYTLRIYLVLLLCILFGCKAVARELPYTNRIVESNLVGATAVVSADFDLDGDEDLAAVSETDHKVIWLEWQGTGYIRHNISASLNGPTDLATGDFDCDGDMDLVIAERGGGAIVWAKNLGSGNWGVGNNISTTTSGVSALAVGDVDGNGSADVVAAVTDNDSVELYRNVDCNGISWQMVTVSSVATGVADVAIADITGDGLLDIVAAVELAGFVTYYTNTNSPIWFSTQLGNSPGVNFVTSGDLDNDGDVDIIAGLSGALNVIAWWNNGASLGWEGISSGTSEYTDIKAVDMDQDGDLDLLTGTSTSINWLDNSQEDGGTWQQRVVDVDSITIGGLVVVDRNIDGDNDIVASDAALGQIISYKNIGSHRGAIFPEEYSSPFPFPLREIPDIASGDIDGDGDLDLVAIDREVVLADAAVSWYENSGVNSLGQLSFSGPHFFHFINGATFGSVSLGDLDGDGDEDVILGGNSTVVESFTFCRNDNLPQGIAWPCFIINPILLLSNVSVETITDIDADGDLDVLATVVESTTGTIRAIWWENAGDPTQSSGWLQHGIDLVLSPSAPLMAADINQDGLMDVLSSGGLWWRNTGGNPLTWVAESIPDALGPPSIGDIDKDGDLDVSSMKWDPIEGISLAWFENNLSAVGSTWTVHNILSPSPNVSPTSIVNSLQDFDLDGDLDYLAGKEGSPDAYLSWFENNLENGLNIWTEHQFGSQLYAPKLLEAQDFDRDGDLDLIVSEGVNSFDGWLNAGAQYNIQTYDVSSTTLSGGIEQALFRIEVFHRGKAGETDLELSEIDLLFEASLGDPLSQIQFNNYVSFVRLYKDDGSGSFDPNNDTEVANFSALTLIAGGTVLQLPDDVADLQHAPEDTPGIYFLSLILEPTVTGIEISTMRVTHRMNAGTAAEDADFDLLLSAEVSVDVSADFLITEQVIFSDGFE